MGVRPQEAANTGRLFEVLKSYSLQHECGEELEPLLLAYRDAVNQILGELWGQHRVREEEGKGGQKAVEAPTQVQGGCEKQEVQEGAQGPLTLGLAL